MSPPPWPRRTPCAALPGMLPSPARSPGRLIEHPRNGLREGDLPPHAPYRSAPGNFPIALAPTPGEFDTAFHRCSPRLPRASGEIWRNALCSVTTRSACRRPPIPRYTGRARSLATDSIGNVEAVQSRLECDNCEVTPDTASSQKAGLPGRLSPVTLEVPRARA